MFRIALAAMLVTACFGCPREVQTPEPGGTRACESLADCNGGRTCGGPPLRACVDDLCEERGSLVLPCLPDGGTD